MTKRAVLLTGAGGVIGRELTAGWGDRFDLRLLDRNPIEGRPDALVADLQDFEAMKRAMEGVETVVHLAAQPTDAPFVDVLVPNNVVGMYHALEAAHLAGVKRFVFASTVQAFDRYPRDKTVTETDLPRPITLYGATKALGETMGRWYRDKHGMEFIAVRIGWFMLYDCPYLMDRNNKGRAIWLSPRDAVGLFARAIEIDPLPDGYALVFATSKTNFERLSLTPAREILGYEPQDDLTKLYPAPEGGW